MCDLLTDPYLDELRAQRTHPCSTEQRMSNAITFRQPMTAGKPWPSELAAPVDPLETTLCARAQSLLTGGEMGVCPPLKPHQARDVLAWAGVAI